MRILQPRLVATLQELTDHDTSAGTKYQYKQELQSDFVKQLGQ